MSRMMSRRKEEGKKLREELFNLVILRIEKIKPIVTSKQSSFGEGTSTMNRNFILLLFLVFYHFSFAQNAPVVIPGTKFSMVPPEGFVLSTNFSGFQSNETGSSIVVADFPASYAELVKGFTKEALKTKGMELIAKEEVTYQQKQATLYKVTQQANGMMYHKLILLFGDLKNTVMVNGIYPELFNSQEKAIRASLFSIKADEKQIANPLEASPYAIDVSGTSYVFVKSLAGSLLYTEDGKMPTKKGMIIVGNSLGNRIYTDEKEHAIERLKKLPNASKAVIQKIEKINISNMEGYEIVAQGDNGQLLYEVMLFTPDRKYYLIVGEANENKTKNLEVFQKVARSFRVK